MPRASCIAASVFDAWSWCASDTLEWRRSPLHDDVPLDASARIEGDNPPGLVFVMRDHAKSDGTCTSPHGASFLPTELARLHAIGYGLADDVLALAPWAIDDATDLLYEHRARPRDVFWVAANSLAALVWGLHDWAHFHNHGPFDQPAMTELQCDLIALAWLRHNAAIIDVEDAHIVQVARDLATLSQRRFAEEGIEPPVTDLGALFRGPYPSATRSTPVP